MSGCWTSGTATGCPEGVPRNSVALVAGNRIRAIVAGGVAGLAVAGGAVAGDGTFTAGTPVATGDGPLGIVLVDLNGDARLDVATADVRGALTVRLGDGAGGFGPALAVGNVTAEPRAVATGDIDNDGDQDLVTLGDSSLSAYRNDGTGSLARSLNLVRGASPVGLAVGDTNGDGLPDFVNTATAVDLVAPTQGDGAGGITGAGPAAPAVGDFPNAVVLVDANRDGAPDIVTANVLGDSVSVVLRSGAGYAAAVNVGAGDGPYALAVGDFNSDAVPDLVTANPTESGVRILVGTGTGAFIGVASPGTGGGPVAVAVGDIDRDGTHDIVTADTVGTATVLLGDGRLGFRTAGAPAVGTAPNGVALGDVNGDGNLDIVTANTGVDTIGVLLGNGAPASAGNLLVNGGADTAGAAGTPVAAPVPPGWTRVVGAPTFVRYGSTEFPSPVDAARWNGGTAFFTGGQGPSAVLEQVAPLPAEQTPNIDAGLARIGLSAAIGGYRRNGDSATVEAAFLGAAGQPIGTPLVIGPVTTAQRADQTILLARRGDAAVPAGTRAVRVRLGMTRTDGAYDDGYVDDVALRLIAPPPPAIVSSGTLPVTAPRCRGRTATIVARGRVTRGTARADVIVGRRGPDVIRGRGGADVICGLGGADLLEGGAGRDVLVGGPGADRLRGGPGPDRLLGGPGRDLLIGGLGRDRLLGGLGRDRQLQ